VKERARRLRERGALALTQYLDGEVGATRRVLTKRAGSSHRAVHQVLLAAPAERETSSI